MDESSNLNDDILRLRSAIDFDAQLKPGTSGQSCYQELDQKSVNLSQEDGTSQEGVSFTGSESCLENCILANHVYQERIQDAIQELEVQLVTNRDLQLKLQRDLQTSCGRKKARRSLSNYSVPYFKDANGHVPPFNEDALVKIANNELDAHIRPSRAWSVVEKQKLMAAVKSSSLEVAMRPLLDRKEHLCTELEHGKLPDDHRWEIEEEVEKKDKQILHFKINAVPLTRDIKCDWLKISSIDFDGKRDAVDCELMWRNYLAPEITKSKWSAEEMRSLKSAVAEHGSHDWEQVAVTLGTGRTALQCIEKYMTKYYLETSNGRWSLVDDEKLLDIVKKCRLGDFIPWHQVTYMMDGKTSNQIWNRWQKIDPLIQKGKWSFQEDLCLLAAVLMLGPVNWWRIKEFVPGRSGTQCHERWSNTLDPSISHKPFSQEEDKLILKLAAEDRKYQKWTTIGQHLKNRTDSMVYNRYLSLLGKKNKSGVAKEIPKKSVGSRSSERYVRELHCSLAAYVSKVADEGVLDENLTDGAKATSLLRHLSSVSHGESDMPASERYNPAVTNASRSQMMKNLIAKLQSNGLKAPVKAGPKPTLEHPVENKLRHYFSSMIPKKRPGRPVARTWTEDSAANHQLVVSELEKILLTRCPAQLAQGTNPVPLLPPSRTSVDAFRKILMIATRLKVRKTGKEQRPEEEDQVQIQTRVDEAVTYCGTVSFPADPDTGPEEQSDEQAYKQLLGTFLSIFLWPAVLSAFPPQKLIKGIPKPGRQKNLPFKKKVHWKKRLQRKSNTQINAANRADSAKNDLPEVITDPDTVDGEPVEKKPKRGRPRGPTANKPRQDVVRRSRRRGGHDD